MTLSTISAVTKLFIFIFFSTFSKTTCESVIIRQIFSRSQCMVEWNYFSALMTSKHMAKLQLPNFPAAVQLARSLGNQWCFLWE